MHEKNNVAPHNVPVSLDKWVSKLGKRLTFVAFLPDTGVGANRVGITPMMVHKQPVRTPLCLYERVL